MGQATTIDEAYRVTDPDHPLEAGSGDPRYVDCSAARGAGDEVLVMAKRVQRSAAPNYSKQLFTGHRGCGKSTELYRLKRLLEADGYFVVFLDVESELDVSDLDYPDVLLAVAQQVETQLRESGIRLKPELLENVANWFRDTIVTQEREREVGRTLETEAGLGAEVPMFARLLATFKGEIKNSTKRRLEIRQELERNAPQLIQRVNDLIDDAQVRLRQKGRAGLVLIIDSLEKLIYRVILQPEGGPERSNHDLLFIDHGEQLRSPNCHMVLTFPINLLFQQPLGQVFPDHSILPMVKIVEEDRAPCEVGREALRQILASRMDVKAIFEAPALVDKLVAVSGGHVRDLLRLVRYAFDYTDTRVGQAHVALAVEKLVNEYDYLTPDEDLPRLHEVYRTRQVLSDKAHSLLLYRLLVLEYRNGRRWADVHPAVQATRKFQASFPAKPAPPKRKRSPGRKAARKKT